MQKMILTRGMDAKNNSELGEWMQTIITTRGMDANHSELGEWMRLRTRGMEKNGY